MSFYKFNQGTLDWISNVNSTNWKIVVGVLMGIAVVSWVIVITTVAMAVAMVRNVLAVVTIPDPILYFLGSMVMGFAGLGTLQFWSKRATDIDLAKAKAQAPAPNAPTIVNQGASVVTGSAGDSALG